MKFFDSTFEYLEYLYNIQPKPRLFAVITWGCCGSTWLAKVLNSHPDIFCLHCLNQHFSYLYGSPYVEGIGYLKTISVTANGYKLAGDIHGVDREELPYLRKVLGKNFRDAVLVRDPLKRLKSMCYCLRRLKGGYSDYSYIEELIESNKLKLKNYSMNEILFVHAVNMLNAIIEETQLSSRIEKIEDLTEDKNKFIEFIDYLSDGGIILDEHWVSQVFSIPKINSHIGDREITFDNHEIEIMNRVIKPEAIKLYENLGYNMRFFRI